MREILFRGKRLNDGSWVEGYFVNQYGSSQIYVNEWGTEYAFDNYHVDINTVGQFTGLTDKNGKKIFEGDIMPVWENGEKYLYKVVYCGDCFMLAMLDSEQGSYPLSIKHNISEVIGNIYEHVFVG